jgi:hypothetical protein
MYTDLPSSPNTAARKDNDSAIGNEVTDRSVPRSRLSYWHTESARDWIALASSAIVYPEENGRRYHAYRAGRYNMPNDEVSLGLPISLFMTRLPDPKICI